MPMIRGQSLTDVYEARLIAYIVFSRRALMWGTAVRAVQLQIGD